MSVKQDCSTCQSIVFVIYCVSKLHVLQWSFHVHNKWRILYNSLHCVQRVLTTFKSFKYFLHNLEYAKRWILIRKHNWTHDQVFRIHDSFCYTLIHNFIRAWYKEIIAVFSKTNSSYNQLSLTSNLAENVLMKELWQKEFVRLSFWTRQAEFVWRCDSCVARCLTTCSSSFCVSAPCHLKKKNKDS